MKYTLKCLKSYFDFKGRARRKEFWMFFLFYFIITVVAMTIDISCFYLPAVSKLLADGMDGASLMEYVAANPQFVYKNMIVTLIASVLLFIPMLSATFRRLHDTGKSGWWVLMPYGLSLLTTLTAGHGISVFFVLLNFSAYILLLVWLCTDSDYDENRWGHCPKTEEGEDYVPTNDAEEYNSDNENNINI